MSYTTKLMFHDIEKDEFFDIMVYNFMTITHSMHGFQCFPLATPNLHMHNHRHELLFLDLCMSCANTGHANLLWISLEELPIL